ncbi:MAG: YbhB/YbcL family Raf kinase inhibitor-like protein [Actinomycetota bacterium]
MAALVAMLVACSGSGGSGHDLPSASARLHLRVSSPAFADGGSIPREYTCDGADVPPPVRWSGAPSGGTFVALMTDADANDFVHWLVYDIPGGTSGAVGGGSTVGIEGRNGFDRNGYGGPCPPTGDAPHHYVISVYEAPAGIPSPYASGESPEEVIPHDVLAQGSLTGTYARQ